MQKKKFSGSSPILVVPLFLCCVLLLVFSVLVTSVHARSWEEEKGSGDDKAASRLLVKRENRRSLFSGEYGEISAVEIGDGELAGGGGKYLLHFFTLEPNSLFLPVILHADMVFYVQTGSGKLSWAEENDLKNTDLRPGDVYRLQSGTVFFMQSYLGAEPERHKLRIHAIFADSHDDSSETRNGSYSSIRDMVLGFDKKVLQAAFKVSEELMDELLSGANPPAIVQGITRTKKKTWEMQVNFISGLMRSRGYNILQLNGKKKERAKLFNLFNEKKDFENDNGWSTTVTGKKLSILKDIDIGLFMVNLTRGSIMGPHWNPVAHEIGIVTQGEGMVRIVCSSIGMQTGCKHMRFKVEEGDVFAVPRLHPMAQMAFENDTFVFAGFSTSAKRNHPQFFTGQASVLRTLDREVMYTSFDVSEGTLDQLLARQKESVILGCSSCAEEELRAVEAEMEKEREEAREREEEEARKREEEARKREEEEAKREEEEEARKREEEARKREEEEAKREEEERRQHEEEEEARRREEEARKREEEEAKREEEERRQHEEEEEARRREEEARKKEEEAAKREEEERKRHEEEEEEEARKREQEQKREREEEEAEARAREEEEAKREEEERRRREEEEEEARRREEEAEERRRREEEEERRRIREEEERREREEEEEAEAREREEEEARREEEERRRREEDEEEARQGEEEEARWEEEERKQREREQEEAKRSEEEEAEWEEKERERREVEEEEAKRREKEEKGRREEEAGEEKTAWREQEIVRERERENKKELKAASSTGKARKNGQKEAKKGIIEQEVISWNGKKIGIDH